MGKVISLARRKGEIAYRPTGPIRPLLSQLLLETRHFEERVSFSLDELPYPIYGLDALGQMEAPFCLEKDFVEEFPLHFALIVLGVIYHRSMQESRRLAEKVQVPEVDRRYMENSAFAMAGGGLARYTVNAMVMAQFSPENYRGERFLLILNPLTERVELWAGIEKSISTEEPEGESSSESSESGGSVPADGGSKPE